MFGGISSFQFPYILLPSLVFSAYCFHVIIISFYTEPPAIQSLFKTGRINSVTRYVVSGLEAPDSSRLCHKPLHLQHHKFLNLKWLTCEIKINKRWNNNLNSFSINTAHIFLNFKIVNKNRKTTQKINFCKWKLEPFIRYRTRFLSHNQFICANQMHEF